MPRVLLEGRGVPLRLHVQEMGSGPPVALLHGLLVGNLATWYFGLAPALAGQHRVLMYDLRGHGRSDAPKSGYGVASLEADLEALVAHWGADRLSLVGHSYGALVALRFALDHPGQVEKLVLIEPPLPPSRLDDMDDLGGLDLAEPDELMGALPGPLQEQARAGGRQARRLIASLAFLAFESSLFDELAAEPDIDDAELARLSCPALCIFGEDSACRPVGDRLARVLPEARLEVLPGGHYLPVERPAEVQALVKDFLDG